MKKHMKQHFWYYFSFVVIQLLGFGLILLTASNRDVQRMMIIGTTCLYAFWALMHQYFHHHLTPKIVVEYMLIGTLGLIVSLFFFGL